MRLPEFRGPQFFGNVIIASGLDNTFTADNRASLQSQWDDAAAQGRALVIVKPGTYKLTVSGSGATRACLRPTDATKRYELWIGPGVVLKMADNQVADGNTVGAMITVQNHAGGGYVGWPWAGGRTRGQGGKLVGNTAGQTGWTVASGSGGTKYAQGCTHAGVLGRDTVAGGGSQNWVIDNITIEDWFGNAIAWSADITNDLATPTTTRNIHFTRLFVDRVGEGLLWGGLYQSSMRDCTMWARSGITVGDGFEPAFSTDCDIGGIEYLVAPGNGVYSGGGAAVDAYCSPSIRIRNVYANGVNNVIQFHGNFQEGTAYERECGTVLVDGVTVVDCGSYVIVWGHKLTSGVVRNVHVFNMKAGSSSPVAGPSSSVPPASGQCNLVFENCSFLNCTSINLGGSGHYTLRNVTITKLSGWDSLAIGPPGNDSPTIHLDGFTASGYPYAFQFSGTSAPVGLWRNVDVSGCTAPKLIQNTATLANVEIPDGLTGETPALLYIGQPLSGDQKPIQGCRAISGFWENGATYTTIPAGHKNQRLRLVPGGQPATLSPSSTLKLAGNTSVSLASPDVMELIYDTANGYWREVSRSINR